MMKLRTMDEAALEKYCEFRIHRHAQVSVETGRCRLPEGLASETERLFSIIDEATDATVGHVWLKLNHEGVRPSAEIHDFVIYNEFRRKGYGTQAFAALEERLRDQEIGTVVLWLQPDNLAAQALSRKAGFDQVGSFMRKRLSALTARSAVRLEAMARADLETYLEGQVQRYSESQATETDPN